MTRRAHHLGAFPTDQHVKFRLWAPQSSVVEVVVEDGGGAYPLDAVDHGYFEGIVPDLGSGDLYRIRLDGQDFPDPASRFQPHGVHGPSQVVDPNAFRWTDGEWGGVDRRLLTFYELHVGTFTPEGTYDGVRQHLDYLRRLGITAIELMPVADFPGRWGWGYDPAALYAPSRAYGTPDDLRRLVDDAHHAGIAVFLDVVYNHLGPDGAYIAAFAPMFSSRHETPWGAAINLDETYSDGIRNFFIDNALHWLEEYHFDGLRLDATHALIDESETHFLAELSQAVAQIPEGPRRMLIAEDPRNIARVVTPVQQGGYGIDAIWTDDFHHQIRNLTAGDSDGYYASYANTTLENLALTLQQGWFFDGRIDPVTGQARGTDPDSIKLDQCVIAIQNHDQIGNRPTGNRIVDDVDPATYRLISTLLLFAAQTPLLFMGQEWGTHRPFLFFSDHNETLGKQVTAGRKEEFSHFEAFLGSVPDPQDQDTFRAAILDWSETEQSDARGLLQLYRDLLRLRPSFPVDVSARAHEQTGLIVRRGRFALVGVFARAAAIPFPHTGRVVLTTENPEYVAAPVPIVVEGGEVRFKRPGAILFADIN